MSASQKRVNSIIGKVSSIGRRLQDTPVTTQPRLQGRGATSSRGEGPTGININENFIKRVNNTTVQTTLYHESIHAEQLRDPALKSGAHLPIMEFHAHSRALRHAMKQPDNVKAVAHSMHKMKKYGAKVAHQYPHLSDNVQRQLDRVDSGQAPAKHSVGYWSKRIKV